MCIPPPNWYRKKPFTRRITSLLPRQNRRSGFALAPLPPFETKCPFAPKVRPRRGFEQSSFSRVRPDAKLQPQGGAPARRDPFEKAAAPHLPLWQDYEVVVVHLTPAAYEPRHTSRLGRWEYGRCSHCEVQRHARA